jgi:tetratricopeptide (TPR) repeat protein
VADRPSDGDLEVAIAHPIADALVGRDRELAVLRAVLDAATAGRPTVALLVGEPGIGKTRLADEAAVIARAAGMRVLRGEADASIREPMELWRRVYRSLGVEPPNDPTLPAADRRWEHVDTLVGALSTVAPAIVVLDDLHWADAMAVWVLEQLPRALGDAPVALVATSRDSEPDVAPLDALRRVSRLVHLGGLDVEAVRQLVATEAGTPVDARQLQARTGGNPLFVRELLHTSDGGGVIDDVLDRSLARFDDGTRELLAAAALAGPDTPLAVLAAATSTTTTAAADRLAVAVRGRVLDEVSGSGVRFVHALLSEAAVRLADGPAVHAQLAAAWAAIGGLGGRTAATVHRLRAVVGTSDVAAVIDAASDVGAELVAAGEQARAAALLQDAWAVSAECLDRPELRAKVALELAEVLGWLGDFDLAHEHYERAAELARETSDVLLRTRAEIGVALFVNPFLPDPSRRRRLEEALAAIPAAELRLRTALLGRLAVVGGADLDDVDQARAWGNEAVDLARRTGDPLLIVQALLDRFMSPPDRAERDARLAVADEVVRLAERVGRGDLALQGHQWHFGHHLNHGALAAASAALERAELLAELLPSPGWRHSTLVRRTTLLALTGDRPAAMAAITQAVRIGRGCIEPLGLLGFELADRLMLLEFYGGADPDAEEQYRTFLDMTRHVSAPFVRVHDGFAALFLGDESRVHGVIDRYAHHPDLLLRSLAGDLLVRLLGDMIARVGATRFVEPVYATLLPDTGCLGSSGGLYAGLPVDDVLSRLAALAGDVPAAVRHATGAVALARSMPSPPMLVHCLDHLGDAMARADNPEAEAAWAEAAAVAAAVGVERAGRQPIPPARDIALRAATMRRLGTRWVVTSPLGAAELPESMGLGQLARLLSTPGVEVTAVELAGGIGAPVATDLGPALDAQAKRAYRRRLLELETEVDHAATCNDPVRAERAQIEIDALLRELERAVGLGGRDRPSGSGAERARINVARSLKRAIAAIEQQAPDLGAHLDVSVRTGRYCGYQPEPAAALRWHVET